MSEQGRGGAAGSTAAEIRMQAVMNAVSDGLIVTNAEGVIEACNTAAMLMFGGRAEDIVGRTFTMLLQDADGARPGNIPPTNAAANPGKTEAGRDALFGRRLDGGVFLLELEINETNVAAERLFIATVRDAGGRRDADRAIEAEVARTVAIMNTVLDGVITIDQDGTIETFNPAAGRIFGYAVADVVGRNVRMLIPEPCQSAYGRYLARYLRTGDPQVIGTGREVVGRRKDGCIFPMELSVSEMNVIGKRLFVGTIRDITERKSVENAMRASMEALSRSNQELDDFAYIASHDLKEPLRGLNNNAIYLKEDFEHVIGEDGCRRVERINYLCKRMERLIDDLLYFSRLGRQDLAMQPTDLNLVIADIELMLEDFLKNSNAKILVAQRLPVIRCDLPRITEVFRNLITNAVKYNDKPEKRVEIGCVQRDGRYVFHVADNGIGIQSQFYRDIFRIFKRLNEEDDKVKGSGVGLTFVKKIIERHGGEIWLESEVGAGTTFYFCTGNQKEN